jgi:putative AlgH/UPF0301 family transcriptional regulator
LGDYPVKVFWWYASWNATQLLGEIARRGWGLVEPSLQGSFWIDIKHMSVALKKRVPFHDFLLILRSLMRLCPSHAGTKKLLHGNG